MLIVLGALGILGLGVGCGKSAKSSSSDTHDAPTLALESAVGPIIASASETEHAASFAIATPAPGAAWAGLSSWALPPAQAAAASCGASRFNPPIPSSSCGGGQEITATFNSCTAGPHGEFMLSGVVYLNFDSAKTCDTFVAGTVPASGSVTRTSTSLRRINPGGSIVTTSALTAANYLRASIGGGVQTTFTGANFARSIAILGLHRTLTDVSGHKVFDHAVHTTAPIMMTGSKESANRLISSGTVVVDHNIGAYSVAVNMAGLGWGQINCCYPTIGTLTATYSGSLAGTRITADFATGTCGKVNISKNGSLPVQIGFASCE